MLAKQQRAFTLIELMVVMAAIGLLLSLAAPRYIEHVDRSRESVLKHNLKTVREAIDRFHADKDRYPKDLQELVSQRYLRELPLDPMTDRFDAWILSSPPGGAAGAGVYDIRSSARGNGLDGRPYASW
ncbi:UNVERIFIED_ORG: prepilin-type N-terminal cleavage/methylation domain-containing protein [Shinella sp. XGS7]|nr:prepilin-type N-terminal cleavage/methylation domain-containing protein [Shinella sp. XGS7]